MFIQLLIPTAILFLSIPGQSQLEKNLHGAGTEVWWSFSEDQIHFKLAAKTTGWVAIGFNETSELKGTYLIMARVLNGQAEVVEHFVEGHGIYNPFENYGIQSKVQNIDGSESKSTTTIEFSLPIIGSSTYRKELKEGIEYHILLAYSHEDDFKHHSAQRTSIKHKL